MKKLSLIFALILMLTACEAKPNLSQPPQSMAEESSIEPIVLTGYNGKGLYLEDATASATALPYVSYTDKQTATRVPLCSVPSCLHDNLDCTAVFNTTGSFFGYKNKLLFFSKGWASGYDSNFRYGTTIEAPSVIMADATGANRETLCSLLFEFYFDCPPAVYGNNLMFFTRTNDEVYLNRFNLHTKVITNFAQKLPFVRYLGSYKNYYVVYDLRSEDNCYVDEISLINMSDGSISHLADIKTPADNGELSSLAYYDGKVYNLKSSKGQDFDILNAIDCKTGENVLISNEIKNQSNGGTQEISAIINDTLIIHSLQDLEDKSLPEFKNLTFNVTTQQQSELTLYVHNPAENFIAPIFAYHDLGDSVIVNQKIEHVKKIFTGTDGAPYQVDTTDQTYAIISKEDYLNNVPNFKTITKTEVK